MPLSLNWLFPWRPKWSLKARKARRMFAVCQRSVSSLLPPQIAPSFFCFQMRGEQSGPCWSTTYCEGVLLISLADSCRDRKASYLSFHTSTGVWCANAPSVCPMKLKKLANICPESGHADGHTGAWPSFGCCAGPRPCYAIKTGTATECRP